MAELAESGNVQPLNDLLATTRLSPPVTVTTDGLLAPGESTQFVLRATGRLRSFSFAAMLIPTNDTFVSLNSVVLPFKGGTVVYDALAYDAGSEINDEYCINIPGPACGGEGASPGSDGEGFVHIASGIHGEGDLLESVYDWRGPVAEVKIKRVLR